MLMDQIRSSCLAHDQKICPDQISSQDKNSRVGKENAVFEHFFSSLYKTELNNDIFTKTVEIVRENWEVRYFYRENKASILKSR